MHFCHRNDRKFMNYYILKLLASELGIVLKPQFVIMDLEKLL